MRPTPDETIASARSLLKDHVAPELSSEAGSQLRRVLSTLRDGRWNERAFDLLNENAALAMLADRCSTHPLASIPSALRDRLSQAASAQRAATPRSFAEANERNHDLRGALVSLVEAMRSGEVAGDESLGNEIVDAMCRLLSPQPASETRSA